MIFQWQMVNRNKDSTESILFADECKTVERNLMPNLLLKPMKFDTITFQRTAISHQWGLYENAYHVHIDRNLIGWFDSIGVRSKRPCPSQARIYETLYIEDGRRSITNQINSAWNDEGSRAGAVDLLKQADFREGIGVSNGQYQKIRETVEQRTTVSSNDIPAIQPIYAEMNKLRMGYPPRSRFDEDAPEETKRHISELQEQVRRAMDARAAEIITERKMNAINDNLTPDQLRKV